MIVVLDTNVWVSGLQFAKHYGVPTQAIQKALSQDVIAICPEIEDEIRRVLTKKLLWEQSRVDAALELIFGRSLRVQLRGNVKVCRDPHDDIFLECASLAHAEYLIAGDKDLLVLGSFHGTRIITPAAYLGIGVM